MELEEYLEKYSNVLFKESPFNEIDAMIFASLSYPHYDELFNVKKTNKSKDIQKGISQYDISNLTHRRKRHIGLLNRVNSSNRYKGIKLIKYISNNDKENEKQFQAVSFIIKDLLIVSYCGTDGTIVGYKEDINMSYLDITPGEIEAIEYLNQVSKKYPYKKIIIVGHSKGGRLAICAAKHYKKADRIKTVYAFDAPNFPKSFYDDDYQNILMKIKRYAPEESIVGRLINEPINCRIVKSTNSLLMQHDTYSWVIEDNHFVYLNGYSKRSTKIVNAFNGVVEKYPNDVKKEFTDILFDLFERLNITKLTTKEKNILLLKEALTKLPFEWRKTPREDRKVLRKILFSLIIDFITD